MVRNYQLSSADVIYAAPPKPIYRNCVNQKVSSWHVLGAVPCPRPDSCQSHYGLCLPVTTLCQDNTSYGTVDLDIDSIERLLEKKVT